MWYCGQSPKGETPWGPAGTAVLMLAMVWWVPACSFAHGFLESIVESVSGVLLVPINGGLCAVVETGCCSCTGRLLASAAAARAVVAAYQSPQALQPG